MSLSNHAPSHLPDSVVIGRQSLVDALSYDLSEHDEDEVQIQNDEAIARTLQKQEPEEMKEKQEDDVAIAPVGGVPLPADDDNNNNDNAQDGSIEADQWTTVVATNDDSDSEVITVDVATVDGLEMRTIVSEDDETKPTLYVTRILKPYSSSEERRLTSHGRALKVFNWFCCVLGWLFILFVILFLCLYKPNTNLTSTIPN
eukprot:TRINITY_DN4595_c0_g1_i1.p1 TRINITY_DN4595_c0_g1~~TRINITY_DN4595_c0_g1_i1.p1  ORF type:complete len:201 (-),score=58.62 TRINITY_DN4595_c0_g1_i1:117-719(-)